MHDASQSWNPDSLDRTPQSLRAIAAVAAGYLAVSTSTAPTTTSSSVVSQESQVQSSAAAAATTTCVYRSTTTSSASSHGQLNVVALATPDVYFNNSIYQGPAVTFAVSL